MVNGWDAYVKGKNGYVGRGGIEKGGIFGGKDGQTWASVDLNLQPEEITKILQIYSASNFCEFSVKKSIYLKTYRPLLIRTQTFV